MVTVRAVNEALRKIRDKIAADLFIPGLSDLEMDNLCDALINRERFRKQIKDGKKEKVIKNRVIDIMREHVIKRMFKEGNRVTDIARVAGVSRRTVRQVIAEHGMPDLIREMFGAGRSISQIAELIGLPKKEIKKTLGDLGYNLKIRECFPVREMEKRTINTIKPCKPRSSRSILRRAATVSREGLADWNKMHYDSSGHLRLPYGCVPPADLPNGSKKDCDRRIAELINQFEKGVNINPEKITFGEYMDIWLKDYARKDLAPRTLIRHKGIIEMHLRPELGSMPLRKITPAHLREYYTKALVQGRKDKKKSKGAELSGTTVLYHHRLIRKMLQDALKTELVYRNVADAVDAPKKEQPEIKPLLKQDVPKLLKVLQNTYLYIPTLIAIATGARQGEVLGLQWKYVNLEEKTIFFRQQLQRFKNSDGEFETVLRPLKTKKSVRRMDIPDSLVSELQKHRLEQKKQCLAAGETWQEHGFVCCHQDGRPIIPFTLSSYFRVMARRAGLEISFHGLRHGHATELISAGMQMNAVRDRLGHSEVGITLNTYAHVTPNQQKEITRIADDILASGLRQN